MLLSSLNYLSLAGLLFIAHAAPLAGFSSAFTVFFLNRKHGDDTKPTIRSRLYFLLSIPSVILLFAYIAIPILSKLEIGVPITPSVRDLSFFFTTFAVGIVAAIVTLRSGVQLFAEAKNKLTKNTELERNKKSDTRTVLDKLPDPMPAYDIEKYVDFAKGTFIGIGEDKKPIYWPPGKTLPHVEVAGTTGSGKGVFIGMLISQNIGQGEAVFVVDPKDDEYLPHVVATSCEKYKKPYHFIDLRPSAPPQLNFFHGATVDQIEELFLAGFGLSETGKASDFYLIADREAAAAMAVEAAKPGATPASLCNEFYDEIKTVMKAEKFAGYLKEMAAMPAVNAATGLDLRKIIKEGGAAYVVGSMRNSKIMRLQKMFTIKLIHLAEERDRTAGKKIRPISLILDEFIYHISKNTLEGLGAARDKGMHITLAHQALSDFARCGADLDKEAVMGAVMENCKLKLIYRIEDPDTALWLAQKSGKIQVDDESRVVETNLALSETVHGRRTIRQAESFYMDDTMIMNLHERLGIVFGIGLPKFSFSSPVKTVKDAKNLVPIACAGARLESAAESLNITPAAPGVLSEAAAASLADFDFAIAPASPVALAAPASSPFPAATPSSPFPTARPDRADPLL